MTAALATLPLAHAARLTIAATAEIGNLPTALGGGYYMSLTNTGSETIACFIFNSLIG